MKLIVTVQILLFSLILVSSHPHLYNPYYRFFRYNTPYYNSIGSYASQLSNYSPLVPTYAELQRDTVLSAYLATPDVLPTLNVLAEVPYSITNEFTTVPMLVVAKDNMKIVSNAEIMKVSDKKPEMTVKTEQNQVVNCTPAVRINLQKPISVYSLKSNILFPSEFDIVHAGYRIPIVVGAILAPVPQDTYVSIETPISVNVVYAVPTTPITIDYVNNGIIEIPDTEAVVVENQPFLPPHNITILEFPDKVAEPVIVVDEADHELVNRQPVGALAPGGIVQSTQPITHVLQFINSKESPVLIALREEALKRN